jgi:fibro-slime domain-containing protein
MSRRMSVSFAWLLWLTIPGCSVESSGRSSGLPGAESGGDDDDDHASNEADDELIDAGDARGTDVASDKDAAVSRPDRAATPSDPTGKCDNALEIVVRDFTEMHPDFEKFTRQVMGIVNAQLGPDQKPVYAGTGGTGATTGPNEFKQWYNDVDGVNKRLSTKIMFTQQGAGVYVFDSAAFFPIDGMGFGNGPKGGGIDIPLLGTIGGGSTPDHNFLFTTEAHTRFTYQGGEKFTFRGDDDMWIFINDQLAIDLGGTHSALAATVDLDADAQKLGLQKGETYPMDIFHAERHTDQSNYHIETTIDLSCIENVPVI